MNLYSISYDLYDADTRYNELEEKIKNSCSKAIKYCESSWIVKYNGKAEDLWNDISDLIVEEDKILILKIDNTDVDGYLKDQDLINQINSILR